MQFNPDEKTHRQAARSMKDPGAPHSGTRSPRLTRELSGFLKHLMASKTRQSDHGSALILTLLITALLATIVVSFLSTSRVEQIAARNFSRQNAATGLAEMATQQAMAKIQQGFTVNGTGTTVITTQPGAIRQFVFQNGTITSNKSFNLFSENGSGAIIDMNNLQNPSSNSSATSNQWTITGNTSQKIEVYMENVTTTVNGTSQILGRIAYYVDDELTKLNINAVTANRSTLNVADSRPLSLTTLSNNTSTLNNLLNTINGTISNNSSLASWGYYFRPEQATANGNNTLNLSPSSDLPYLTALPPRDFHMKYTPWGARRLFINDLATDTTNATASVNTIYNALSDPRLRDIYGQTYADKYTALGLNQLAANMLQMKNKNTMNRYVSMGSAMDTPSMPGYYGPLIGSDNLDSDGIPQEYLGYAPWFGINEVGISGRLAIEKVGTNISMRNILQVCIETIGWKVFGHRFSGNNTARIIVDLDSFTYDVNYTQNGNTTTTSLGGSWPTSGSSGPFTQFCTNANSTYTQNFGWDDPMDWRNGDAVTGNWSISAGRGRNPGNGALSCLADGVWNRYHIGTLGRVGRGGEISMGFSYPASSNITINGISNIKASIKKIRLLANWQDSSTIRDWVVAGRDIGDFPITLSTANLTGFSFPFTANNSTTINATWADPEPVPPPSKSYGKLDPRLRSVSALSTSTNPWPAFTASNATFAWGGFSNSTWGDTATVGYGITNAGGHIHLSCSAPNPVINSDSNWTKNNMIPGDPPIAGRANYAAIGFHMEDYFRQGNHGEFATPWNPFYLRTNFSVACWPHYINSAGAEMWFLDSNGNNLFIAPADLGKVVTNYHWRTLRMQLQPANEVAAIDGGGNKTTTSLIPDWAMLDVISFGTNSTTIPLNFAAHVNLNNKFATVNGTHKFFRNIGLESLLQSFDNVNSANSEMLKNPFGLNNLTGNIAISHHLNTTCYDQFGNATVAVGLGNSTTWPQLLARNIGNMTWSPLSVWGSNSTAASRVRKSKGFPTNQFVLPSEVTEIRDIADLVSTNSTTFESSTRYTNLPRSIKSNELRLSTFFPGATTCSNFFSVYAYAQSGRVNPTTNQFEVDSEALTKTMVEVEITTPATATAPAQYKVKKLYTQPIPMGQ
jgi:hypothetical protein